MGIYKVRNTTLVHKQSVRIASAVPEIDMCRVLGGILREEDQLVGRADVRRACVKGSVVSNVAILVGEGVYKSSFSAGSTPGFRPRLA